MTKKIHRKLLIAALFLGTAAALSACGAGSDSGTGAAAPPAAATSESATTAPATPPNAPANADASTGPTSQPTGTTTPTDRPAGMAGTDNGCPVSGDTLLKVIRKYDDFVHTTALTDVECYKGWATASQQVAPEWVGKVQPVAILFRYEPKWDVWTYATAGTGGICPDYVPADARKHFKACG